MITEKVGGRVTSGAPIARYTSFRVGGPAALMVEPDGTKELAVLAEVLAGTTVDRLVLGRGSNMLVSDRGFPGVVVRLGKGFEWIRSVGDAIQAGGGTPLPQVTNRAVRLGLTGLEFGVAIPATVGGAVRMNAGAHGRSVADVLASATICDFTTGLTSRVVPADLKMEYRHTAVGPGQVVSEAEFHLSPAPRESIALKMEEYREHRSATQPVDAPNAGSMFRNPPGSTAGALIEQAGLKGRRVGRAEVSMKHGNFFLARPGATAQDIFDLMAEVQRVVEEGHGVLLVPEVRIVGHFERRESLRA